MRRTSFGLVFAAAMVGAASAQTTQQWIFNDNPDEPVLQYGTPDSDEALIAFSCEPRGKTMRIVEFVGSDQLKPGLKTNFKLTAGTTSLDLTGDAVANEMDGTVNVSVSGAPNPRLFALLKAGPTLRIDVPGGTQTVPLAGLAAHLPVFEKLCLGRH